MLVVGGIIGGTMLTKKARSKKMITPITPAAPHLHRGAKSSNLVHCLAMLTMTENG
jgi:hypothetical protein